MKTTLLRNLKSSNFYFNKNIFKNFSSSNYTYKVVFIRHGESVWNQENRFTGWTDVDLTEKGRQEAKEAGEKLNNFSTTLFEKDITPQMKKEMEALKKDKQEKCEAYEMMAGDKMLEMKKECEEN